MAEKRTVEVSIEYLEQLEADSQLLDALCAAGVDSWDGYEQAQELMESM